jgi:protein phosphatase
MAKRSVHAEVVGESDIGLVRERNEDVLLAMDLASGESHEPGAVWTVELGERGILLAVLDGMGGAAAGDRASRLAADIFSQRVQASGATSTLELGRSMGSAILEANRRIREEGLSDPGLFGMGTTLTAAAVLDRKLVLAHVGDSRAYLLRRGQLVQLTEDQSLVHELVTSGQLRDEDAQRYEHNNVILQALGVTEDLVPVGGELELGQGDLLLLCTDGLSSLVPRDEIQEVLAGKGEELHVAATALTAQARVHGGHDNITVVLARFGGDDLRPVDADLGAPSVTPVSIAPGARPWHRRSGLSPVALVALAVLLMLTIAGVILLIGMD